MFLDTQTFEKKKILFSSKLIKLEKKIKKIEVSDILSKILPFLIILLSISQYVQRGFFIEKH